MATDKTEGELNRVVYVKAHFREEWVKRKIWVKRMGENSSFKLLGFLTVPKLERVTKKVKVAESECEIDGERLSEDIRAATLALNEQGYEVIDISPITSGQFSPRYDKTKRSRAIWRNNMRQIGFGYSYTEGVILVSKLREDRKK